MTENQIMRKSNYIVASKYICILALILLVTLTGCDPNHTERTHSTVNITLCEDSLGLKQIPFAVINNDTFCVDKIEISRAQEKNKAWTHVCDFFRDLKIDINSIWDSIRNNRWHAGGVLVFWLSVSLVFFFICRFIFKYFRVIYNNQQKQSLKYQHYGLQTAAYITLLSGCVLYYVGFYKFGTAASFAAYFIRPLIASLSMFVGNTSYQEISEECTNSPVYMTLFGLIHLSAIIISAVVVINFFWKRLASSFVRKWWWLQATLFKHKKTVNIFLGSNEPSFILAGEMIERGEHVVFIDSSNETDRNQQMTLSQIFGLFPYDRELMQHVKGWNCVIMNTAYDITKEDKDNEYILDKLGISRLRTIINTSEKARIFFLSDNALANVKSIINILDDIVFKHPTSEIDIFVHAPRNSHNIALERKFRNIEDYKLQPAVHIIDSSYLSIQWLKTRPEYHPIQFVIQSKEEQKRGVVNNAFNALIVGFGETGQEAASFLYEFAAFVTDNQVRSPFKCHIVDPNIESLKSEFLVNRPALKDKQEFDFMAVSDKDEEYWGKIEKIIPTLQYVVVSTGSDELNMKIAVDVYKLAIRCRENNLSNFKIFVRSYSMKNEQLIERIANFYNKENSVSLGKIVVFGKMTDIYTYDNIVLDKVLREAKRYGDKYYVAFKKLESIVGKEDIKLTGLAEIRKKHRSLSQDIANSLHASTKFLLMGLDDVKLMRLFTGKNLTNQEQHVKSMLIEISKFSDDNEFLFGKNYEDVKGDETKLLMYNMALCEHLRWNAAHEMMGYTYGEEKSEIVKRHDCLTEFCNLPKFPKNPCHDKGDYDYLVLETSIKLKMEECNEKINKQ